LSDRPMTSTVGHLSDFRTFNIQPDLKVYLSTRTPHIIFPAGVNEPHPLQLGRKACWQLECAAASQSELGSVPAQLGFRFTTAGLCRRGSIAHPLTCLCPIRRRYGIRRRRLLKVMLSSLGIPFCAEVCSRDRTTYDGSTDGLYIKALDYLGFQVCFHWMNQKNIRMFIGTCYRYVTWRIGEKKGCQ
jgi:hypothetical protein